MPPRQTGLTSQSWVGRCMIAVNCQRMGILLHWYELWLANGMSVFPYITRTDIHTHTCIHTQMHAHMHAPLPIQHCTPFSPLLQYTLVGRVDRSGMDGPVGWVESLLYPLCILCSFKWPDSFHLLHYCATPVENCAMAEAGDQVWPLEITPWYLTSIGSSPGQPTSGRHLYVLCSDVSHSHWVPYVVKSLCDINQWCIVSMHMCLHF